MLLGLFVLSEAKNIIIYLLILSSVVPKGYTPYTPYTLGKFQDNLGCT